MRCQYHDPHVQGPMRWRYDDPHLQAHMMRAEEMLEEARAYVALQVLLRESRVPRRRARVWLGSVLLAVGHRLLQSAPTPHAPASPHEIRPRNRDGVR
jgi:hypothetical protein